MKVKLIELYGLEYLDSDEHYGSKMFYSLQDSVDWEDVSKEELEILKRWMAQENRVDYRKKYILAVESDLSPLVKVREIIKEQEKEQIKRDKQRKLQEAEKLEKSRKRKEKQLAKLQQELGVK